MRCFGSVVLGTDLSVVAADFRWDRRADSCPHLFTRCLVRKCKVRYALRVQADDSSVATRLLHEARQGNKEALGEVVDLVYEELRKLARRVRRSGPSCSVQTGSLVHEAFLKLFKQEQGVAKNRAHFLAIATIQMRRVLIDHMRSAQRLKRGGQAEHVAVQDVAIEADAKGDRRQSNADVEERLVSIMDLERCLGRLEKANPRSAQIVSLRILGRASMDECAEVMGMTRQTVHKYAKAGQAWLAKCLRAHELENDSRR